MIINDYYTNCADYQDTKYPKKGNKWIAPVVKQTFKLGNVV